MHRYVYINLAAFRKQISSLLQSIEYREGKGYSRLFLLGRTVQSSCLSVFSQKKSFGPEKCGKNAVIIIIIRLIIKKLTCVQAAAVAGRSV